MANQTLFNTKNAKHRKVKATDTVNAAGGRAYSRSNEAALAQFAATGMFNNTYYVKAEAQLDEVLKLAQSVRPEFLAKVAVYSRKAGYLKDMPAVLLAVLLTRDTALFRQAFPLVVDNGKMLRNFVQVIRSGVVGRTSLGSAAKKAIREWFDKANEDYIFKASVGNDPSLADVIKLARPVPDTKKKDHLYSYLLGRDTWDGRSLPQLVKDYEKFKKSEPGKRNVPDVPFQMLDSLGLSTEEWKEIARNARWQMTRMNLNTFKRHGVFEDKKLVGQLAARLADPDLARRARQYPYQVLTAYKAVERSDLPHPLIRALHDAVDHCAGNIPQFQGRSAILVDISASMGQSVNPRRGGYSGFTCNSGEISCREVAGLFAASIVRVNPDAVVYQFANTATRVRVNPLDTVFTNTEKITRGNWGGTDISSGLRSLVQDFKAKDLPDTVIVVSDNESWIERPYWGRRHGTSTMHAWEEYKKKNKNARMVLLDLTPTSNTSAYDRRDILNVGGFSDKVFDVVAGFTESGGGEDFWAKKIEREVIIGE